MSCQSETYKQDHHIVCLCVWRFVGAVNLLIGTSYYLYQMEQCDLELASGQNSDLLLHWGSGQAWGGRTALLGACWQATTGLCLREHTGREQEYGGHSGWYSLGGDDLDKQVISACRRGVFHNKHLEPRLHSTHLKLQHGFLIWSGYTLVKHGFTNYARTWVCTWALSGPQESRGKSWTEARWLWGGFVLLLLDKLELLEELMRRHHTCHLSKQTWKEEGTQSMQRFMKIN